MRTVKPIWQITTNRSKNTRFFYKKHGEGPSSKSFLFIYIVWNTVLLVLNVSYLVS